MKFVASSEAVEGTLQLGWQAHHLPIIGVLAAVLWGGLYLRDARVRALLRPAR